MDANGGSKAATPWGAARLVDELTLHQRAGEKRFASIVQLLEAPRGERLVRFAYSTGGTARRGPVTLRLRDLERQGLIRLGTGRLPRNFWKLPRPRDPKGRVLKALLEERDK